jgi:flagellar motor switch protein FliN/FliY
MTALQSEVKGTELAFSPEMQAAAAHRSVPWVHRIEEHPSWPVLAEIPETMIVYIPLPGFTLRQLLELEKGKVVLSASPTADLVPMGIGSVRLVWGEFEMINRNLALRVTKLA